MMRRRIALAAAVSAVALVGLMLATSAGSANSRTAKTVTFNKDVAPIFFNSCAECHRPNDIAPMSLLSFKEARPWARSIKEKVVTREMPPWSPDPRLRRVRQRPRLSQQEIDTMVAWVDQGAKEGRAKDLPPSPEFTAGRLADSASPMSFSRWPRSTRSSQTRPTTTSTSSSRRTSKKTSGFRLPRFSPAIARSSITSSLSSRLLR